jgi:hypothetical protein
MMVSWTVRQSSYPDSAVTACDAFLLSLIPIPAFSPDAGVKGRLLHSCPFPEKATEVTPPTLAKTVTERPIFVYLPLD